MLAFEAIFLLDIIINFLLSYVKYDTQTEVIECHIVKTITNYLSTTFYKDFIPIIPLQLMELPNKRNLLFFLIKLMRLFKGFRILDVHALMKKIKAIYKERSVNLIKSDPKAGEDMLNDHNKI